MLWEFFWYYLIPLFLLPLYDLLQYRAVAALGFDVSKTRVNWIVIPLTEGAFIFSWLMTGFLLPVFYIGAYLLQAVFLLIKRRTQMRFWYLINMNFTNLMTLHLLFVGTSALLQGVSMDTLLSEPLWRTAGIFFVLTAAAVEDLVFLSRPQFSERVALQVQSDEARPFVAFLWFSNAFLLGDSLLCAIQLEPFYPPLLLIGSNVVLSFFVIRFLLHINTLIRDAWQREEHETLSAQLEEVRENTGVLRRMTDRDPLTGIFSRRYIMEQIQERIETGQPFALAYLDLDGLKKMNDKEGHDAGDRYLIRFTQTLGSALEPGGVLARVGGDEFVVLLPACSKDTAQQKMGALRDRMETAPRAPRFRFSFGVSWYSPENGKNTETLLQEADHAMYQDKARRR